MLIRHHESTQDLEYKHLAVLQKMKDEQLRRQHETERENQTDYNQCAEAELRKKHNMEVKQQPRSLKVRSHWFSHIWLNMSSLLRSIENYFIPQSTLAHRKRTRFFPLRFQKKISKDNTLCVFVFTNLPLFVL